MKIHPTLGDRFAVNLAKEREARSLGQRAFARLVGVSPSLISFFETKQKHPSLEMVDHIAKKLGKKSLELLK